MGLEREREYVSERLDEIVCVREKERNKRESVYNIILNINL